MVERAVAWRRLWPRVQTWTRSRALRRRALTRISEGGATVQPRHQERDPSPGGALVGLLRHSDQRRAKEPVLHDIARLHFLDDGARLLIAGDFHHRLVPVRVQRFADRFDAGDSMA